jgi:hypothetical protein
MEYRKGQLCKYDVFVICQENYCSECMIDKTFKDKQVKKSSEDEKI